MVLSFLYDQYATAKWRNWAYESVGDIHQLQRSAEMAGLLMRGSYEKAGTLINKSQKRRLKGLQERFSEEHLFVDDPSVPSETFICPKSLLSSSSVPEMVLSDIGIQFQSVGFFEWRYVENERIVQKTYSKIGRYGQKVAAGSMWFFRFECGSERYELELKGLDITLWKLDLLLYVYKGRFTAMANE